MITNIQLMEWLAKGNGIAKNGGGSQCIPYSGSCSEDLLDKPIREDIRIRKWHEYDACDDACEDTHKCRWVNTSKN